MIRDHPRFHSTSIIFVSAISVDEVDLLKGYQHGAVDYVPVPVVPELLRAKVRVFAELYRKTQQLEHLNAELEQRVAERTADLADANALLEQRVDQRTREREAALAKIHQMQKMDSLGQLTGGLAHDFNNLLMGISASLELLGKKIPADPSAQRLLKGAAENAQRGAALTKRMLAFARKQELSPEPVDVAKLVENMREMLTRSLGPTISIELDFAPNLAHINVDPNQLELAILNLALNGRDAMPNGGRMRITGMLDANHDAVIGLTSADYVRLSVADTGEGMDEATLARATEPFFTTKEVGKGTGLGLSMVHGLAVQSGGGIRLTSQPGKGTVVDLWLPLAGAAGSAASAPEPAYATGKSVDPRRVLVVDDDRMVAELTVGMLEELGHLGFIAASGRAALEILATGTKIDMVITDHAMPGMTGVELAGHIRQSRPDMPIVLATGYADVGDLQALGLPRLMKPYHLEALASVMGAAAARSNKMAS
jgi:signal transduction histidine kinase